MYRVKHKLDGSEYAVKKIPIRSEGIESVKSYLSEVKTFASLNHSNIVQYKAAWLELGVPKLDKAIKENYSEYSDSVLSNMKTQKRQKHNDNYIYPCNASEDEFSLRKNDNSSDFEVDFENTSLTKLERHYSYSNNNIVDEEHKPKRQKRNSISEGGNVICTIDIEEMQHLNAMAQTKWATLYIQMALCQTTLKQWLEKRNMSTSGVSSLRRETALMPVSGKVREDTVMEILRQLLRGKFFVKLRSFLTNLFSQVWNTYTQRVSFIMILNPATFSFSWKMDRCWCSWVTLGLLVLFRVYATVWLWGRNYMQHRSS